MALDRLWVSSGSGREADNLGVIWWHRAGLQCDKQRDDEGCLGNMGTKWHRESSRQG
jgi:hypothetical protein